MDEPALPSRSDSRCQYNTVQAASQAFSAILLQQVPITLMEKLRLIVRACLSSQGGTEESGSLRREWCCIGPLPADPLTLGLSGPDATLAHDVCSQARTTAGAWAPSYTQRNALSWLPAGWGPSASPGLFLILCSVQQG